MGLDSKQTGMGNRLNGAISPTRRRDLPRETGVSLDVADNDDDDDDVVVMAQVVHVAHVADVASVPPRQRVSERHDSES